MKTISVFTQTATAGAILLSGVPAIAADAAQQNPAYWVDSSGQYVHNASGECWRSGAWSAALAAPPCDPGPRVSVMPVPIAVPQVVAQAAPVTPAPAPVAPVVPVPAPRKLSFSGDALFGFDSAALLADSRGLLDELVRTLAGASPYTLTVTGHTDRIGNAAYNQKLSERRALAVKDYLVQQNLQVNAITARGMGETQPVTAAADCKGSRASAQLIRCLQSDRRVDIEMTGTQAQTALQ